MTDPYGILPYILIPVLNHIFLSFSGKMMSLGDTDDLDRQEREATEALLKALSGAEDSEIGVGGRNQVSGDSFNVENISDKDVEDDYLALLAEAGLENESEDEIVGGSEDDVDLIRDSAQGAEQGTVSNKSPPIKRSRHENGDGKNSRDSGDAPPPPPYTKTIKNEPMLMKTEIKRLQAQALMEKRAGNLAQAKALVLQYKALKDKLLKVSNQETPANHKKPSEVDRTLHVQPSNKLMPVDARIQKLLSDIAKAKKEQNFDLARKLFKDLKSLKQSKADGHTLSHAKTSAANGKPSFLPLLKADAFKSSSKTEQIETFRSHDGRAKGRSFTKQESLKDLQGEIMKVRRLQTEAMQRGDSSAVQSLYEKFLRLNSEYQAAVGMKTVDLKYAAHDDDEQRSKSEEVDVDESDIQLSDGDDEDPEMLAALSAIESSDGNKEEEIEDDGMEEGSQIVSEQNGDEKISNLEDKLQSLKMLAVMAKQSGDLSKAKELFVKYKQLKTTKDSLLSKCDERESEDIADAEGETTNVSQAIETQPAAQKTRALPSLSRNNHKSAMLESEIKDSELESSVTLNDEVNEIRSQMSELDVKIKHLKSSLEVARRSNDSVSAQLIENKYKKALAERDDLVEIFKEVNTEMKIKEDNATRGSSKSSAIMSANLDETANPAEQSSASDHSSKSDLVQSTLAFPKLDTEKSSMEYLKMSIKELQRKALTAKKDGDMDQCKQHFAAYKALQKKLQGMQASPSKNAETDATSSEVDRLAALQSSANLSRNRALEYKKTGDLMAAKQELAQYKLFKSQIDALIVKGGPGVTAKAQEEAKKKEALRNSEIDQLDNIVMKEIAHLQRVLKLAQASEDTDLIRELAKAASRAKAQRHRISQYRSGGTLSSRPVPKLKVNTVVDRLKVKNMDVPVHTMSLTIHSINDFPYKGDPERALNIFIKFDFGYPRAAPIQGQTRIITGKGRLISFEKSFPLGLGSGRLSSKATLRHFEKRRINFSIWCRKSGLFSSENKCVGKACAELAPLLSQSVLKAIDLPLYQESRRQPTGGSLRVTMKLRKPLQGDDIRSVKRNVLVL